MGGESGVWPSAPIYNDGAPLENDDWPAQVGDAFQRIAADVHQAGQVAGGMTAGAAALFTTLLPALRSE